MSDMGIRKSYLCENMAHTVILILLLIVILFLACCSPAPKQVAKPIIERDYNKMWKALAPYVMQHFDTGDLTVKEVAAGLAYQHYLSTKEREQNE